MYVINYTIINLRLTSDSTSELNHVVADLNNVIDNDPPEGNLYDIAGHFKTSLALKDTNNRLDMIEVGA